MYGVSQRSLVLASLFINGQVLARALRTLPPPGRILEFTLIPAIHPALKCSEEQSSSLARRNWRLPNTSTALSIVYYACVALIAAPIIACSVVGYIDYRKWRNQPVPRWIIWTERIFLPCCKRKRQDQEFLEQGVWPIMCLRTIVENQREQSEGWMDMNNGVPASERPSGTETTLVADEIAEGSGALAKPKRTARWADVIESGDCGQQSKMGLPDSSPPPPPLPRSILKKGGSGL